MNECTRICDCGGTLCLREQLLPGDLQALRRLLAPLLQFTPEELELAVELAWERLERGAASGYEFLLLENRDAELAGYACYGRVPCTRQSWDLYWIAVRKERQKTGLGSLLLQLVESRILLQGGGRLYVETSSLPRYTPTRGFYRRAGFMERARFPEFYAPGDDKLVFEKIV